MIVGKTIKQDTLKPLNTKKTTVCVVLNPGSGLGQAHSCDGIYKLTQFKKTEQFYSVDT
jgi:hypothetical protein